MLRRTWLVLLLSPLLAAPTPPSSRLDRLVALARLDAAVHYFHPVVATRLTSWDSLFAAHAVSIADAPSRAEYGRRVAALMDGLHDDAPVATTPQRALEYNGFPPTGMQTSGGYTLRWRKASAGETYRVEMGEGIHVDVRLSEGSRESSGTTQIGEPPGDPEWRKAYPTAGYRILGAARLWSTIHYFFPYKALIVDNWDAQLRIALPKVELAKNALAYGIAIAEFAAHIGDSHVSVGSAALSVSIGTGAIGTGPIGAAARLVESQLVITRIVDSSASRAGLRVGDVVVSVDGVSIASRIKRLMPLLAASTPQAMRSRLNATLLRGPDDSAARLVVRRADGRARTVSVPRDVIFASKFRNQRDGSIVRLLPSNIGYVDLDRLSPAMVDGAFRKLAGTKAIVFDMRGYPQGTAWAIAARLNTHGAGTTAAKFKRLIVPSPDTTRTTVYDFDQSIPSSFLWRRYSGRTVMLIDERTMSQAEHTGLFFEAANGTEFIGSPTVGANGDVTSVLLPGNIGITFTGHDVRHADGRQLQRVGLIPHLTVNPTISGIRAGRDEVLDAAFHHVGGTGVIPPDTVP